MSVNSKINLVSAEVLIGEFLQDYDMTSTNFISRLNRHIVRGIELMNIDTYYIRCVKAFVTEENRTLIPCSAKFIEAIVLNGGNCAYFLELTNNNLRLLNKDNLNGVSEIYGYVDDAYLNLKDFDGAGFFVYKSLPTTKKGYVKLPDDPFVMEAILYFIISKLALSGYKHKVVSRKEAEIKWRELYPQARNSVNFPTPDDIERYTVMTTSPLYDNIDRVGETNSLSDIVPNIELISAYPSLVNTLYNLDSLSAALGLS